MKKRLISLIVIVCLSLCMVVPAFGVVGLSNFDRLRTYSGGFADVSHNAWYYDSIRSTYEYGIMDGKSDTIFSPSGKLTIAEAIKLASVLHQCYYTGTTEFNTASAAGLPWYKPYVDYAARNGIITGSYRNYNAYATRGDFAVIIAGAMQGEAVTPINSVPDGAIPDVAESYSYGEAVYTLYRAGVLTGADESGTFYPNRTLSRAEAAAAIMRIIDADTRQSLALAVPLQAEQVYKQASPCVFYVEVFDSEGLVIKTGSGFFITDTGIGVTNYHVLIGGVSAKITTDDGEVFDVSGIYDYAWKRDIALIQTDGTGFPYLEIASSDDVLTGATIYSLGSPLGLQATFSKGIVSQSSRDVDGIDYIQIDAAISPGSSGGVLLDIFGRAIGITSASMLDAQNLNFAVPINTLAGLNRHTHIPLKALLEEVTFYKDHFPAPDFGAYFGIKPFFTNPSGPTNFSYLLSDLPGDADPAIEKYLHAVEQNLFTLIAYREGENGEEFQMYHNSTHGVRLTVGKELINGKECYSIEIDRLMFG